MAELRPDDSSGGPTPAERAALQRYVIVVAALALTGRTINVISLAGVAFALGMTLDNTIVVLSSDNGGAGYVGLPDINAPYRGWKITLFEGGIRVPMFVRWPQRIG